MATIRRCDKCGSEQVLDRRRKFNLDLCEKHLAELELWRSDKNAIVMVRVELKNVQPIQATREAPEASHVHSTPAPMPQPQTAVMPSPGGLQAGAVPRTAHVQVHAPMRPNGVAAPDDARAPTRAVAPGFPFPGGHPDFASERAAAEQARAAAMPPPTALLDAPPPPPPDDPLLELEQEALREMHEILQGPPVTVDAGAYVLEQARSVDHAFAGPEPLPPLNALEGEVTPLAPPL